MFNCLLSQRKELAYQSISLSKTSQASQGGIGQMIASMGPARGSQGSGDGTVRTWFRMLDSLK